MGLGYAMESYIVICAAHPVLGHFLIHLGWPDINQRHLMFNYVKRDIEEGQKLKRFNSMATELALCLVGVSAIAGIQVMLLSDGLDGVPEETAAAILRALGLPDSEASAIAAIPLTKPSLPETGLIFRATSLANAIAEAE